MLKIAAEFREGEMGPEGEIQNDREANTDGLLTQAV